ncbi:MULTISPECIES: hypothetical protein [Haloarcula]|uniref:hypothetical protein n=1 Tax=Haloarcula TaxID=2237 RepID=UPI00166CD54F|nr:MULTISPECIES: hypothetical protein [Halomicroarcula]MBX0346766.1 hypothetical protein [Halomicroarcula pellucida]MDS0277377.1 hypothetical protein [Halomicroarcula sp. S1AR25-4]
MVDSVDWQAYGDDPARTVVGDVSVSTPVYSPQLRRESAPTTRNGRGRTWPTPNGWWHSSVTAVCRPSATARTPTRGTTKPRGVVGFRTLRFLLC